MFNNYKKYTNKFNFAIAIIHWIFYSFFILPVLLNAETWFYGEKYSGIEALIIHFSVSVFGLVIGYLIYKKYIISYFLAFALFIIAILFSLPFMQSFIMATFIVMTNPDKLNIEQYFGTLYDVIITLWSSIVSSIICLVLGIVLMRKQ